MHTPLLCRRGGGDIEAQPFIPSSSALGWQNIATTHFCLTAGDPELPTSTHTPVSWALAKCIPTLTVPERMEDKGALEAQPGFSPEPFYGITPLSQSQTPWVEVPWGILYISSSAGPATPDITLERLRTLSGFLGTGTPWAGSDVQPFDRGPGARLPATRPPAQTRRSARSAQPPRL